ncbi:MAG: DUF3429 domain-containing protein [Acetobacteraceae bacterium]|nr:DUF3429 domain-containing protein [Pseudomonadota bacterium]
MPTAIIPLTLLGLVPFFVLAVRSVSALPLVAQVSVIGLIDYAALVLGFIGGIHWGLALLPETVRPTLRAIAGIVPMIAAWICMVLAQFSPTIALVVLVLAYLATVFVEHRAAQRLMLAPRYVYLRWGFSVVACVMMLLVVVLRGFGQTIVL